MKKTIKLLSTLVVMLGILIMCDVPASAAGNSIATATPISVGQSYRGTISNTNESDFYKINLSTSGELKIKLRAYIYETSYYIYDSEGNSVWEMKWRYWNSVSEQFNMNESVHLTSGTYYFCVEQSDGTGNYNFTLGFTSANENFKETTNGINNTMMEASTISTDKVYKGQLAQNDGKDFYKFNLSTSGCITIKLRAYIYATSYYIYDSQGNVVWEMRWKYWNSVSEQLDMNEPVHLTSGTYYFCVEQSDGTGNYNFKLGFVSAKENFKETTGGINNTLATASKISLNTIYNGQLAQNDNKDFYKFTMPFSGNVKFAINAYIYETNYYIYDSKGNVVWEMRWRYWNDSTKKYADTHVITLSKGTYYLCVEQSDGCGNYNFKISPDVYVGSVYPLKASSSTSAIALSWNGVSGASGYQVYRYSATQKKYVRLADVTSRSYKLSRLQSGTSHTFAVRAYRKYYGSYYFGSLRTITTATKPGTPLLKAKAGSKKVSLSWTRQAGASGYVVYMATSKYGKYTAVAVVKGGNKGTYTKTRLAKNKTYFFKVKAYKTAGGKNIYGNYSAVTAKKPKR